MHNDETYDNEALHFWRLLLIDRLYIENCKSLLHSIYSIVNTNDNATISKWEWVLHPSTTNTILRSCWHGLVLSLSRWRKSKAKHPHLTLEYLREAFINNPENARQFKLALREYQQSTDDHNEWRNKVYAHGDKLVLSNKVQLPKLTIESVEPAIAHLDTLIRIISEELPDEHKMTGLIDNRAGMDLVTAIQTCHKMRNIQRLLIHDDKSCQDRLSLISVEAFRKPDFTDTPASSA